MRICKYILSLLLVFIIPIGFITCDNYEFPKSPYPRIETLVVTDITENGVNFQANLIQLGNQPITNHGFVWGITEDISIASEDKVQLGAQSNAGKFEAIVKSGLEKDVTYFVKAFVATKDYFVYGKAIEFTSKGSMPPHIKDFSPLEATWGDTITIKGNYFSALNKNNLVRFGSINSNVVASNDSIIKCIVPPELNNKNVKISIEVAGNKSESLQSFRYKTPAIVGLASDEAAFSDTIRILMDYYNLNYVQVSFNSSIAEITSTNLNFIEVIVPNSLTVTNPKIIVTSAGFSDELNGFQLKLPAITNITPTTITNPNNPITILGNNFNLDKSFNQIKIFHPNGIQSVTQSEILLLEKGRIIIQPNLIIFGDLSVTLIDEFIIEITTHDFKTDQVKVSVKYLSTWTKKKDFPGLSRYNAVGFAINGKGYFGTGFTEDVNNNLLNDFWEYDPVLDQWLRINDLPGTPRAGAVSFTINNNAYVGLGLVGDYNKNNLFKDFYRYNSSTSLWTKVSDFQGVGRLSAASFTLNNKGYVGTGDTGNSFGSSTDDFWEYNPATDSWTEVAKFPLVTDKGVGFSIGNIGYIYDYSSLYAFNGHSWNRQNSVSLGAYENIAFSINGYGYFGLGLASQLSGTNVLWKYDPQTGNSTYHVMPNQRCGASVFVINDKAYIIGGYTYPQTLNDVWEFDPSKPELQ